MGDQPWPRDILRGRTNGSASAANGINYAYRDTGAAATTWATREAQYDAVCTWIPITRGCSG
jgi:hypothetical protein